jgi:hypothetical protein
MLVLALCAHVSGPQSGAGRFLVNGMLLLTFPVGVAVAGWMVLLKALRAETGIPFPDVSGGDSACLCLMWIAFFLAGCWQWYRLLPWLRQTWRALP